MTFPTFALNHPHINQHDNKGLKIKKNWHVESSGHSVQDPSNFINQTSFRKNEIASFVCYLQVVKFLPDSAFKLIVGQRPHQNMRYLNNDFQGNEMDDAMFDVMLVGKQIEVNYFCHNVDPEWNESYAVCDKFIRELFGMVVDELHESHASFDMWAKKKM